MDPDKDDQVDDFLRQAVLIGLGSARLQRIERRRKTVAAAAGVAVLLGVGAFALTRGNDDEKAAPPSTAIDSSQVSDVTATAATGANVTATSPSSDVTLSSAVDPSSPPVSSAIDTQPTDSQPTDSQPTDSQPIGTLPTDTLPTDTQPPDTQPSSTPVAVEVLAGLPQATFPGGQPWPNALYENDILYLRGTVPSREVADSVVARLVPILGEEFIVDELVIDETVPLVESAPVRLGNGSVLFKSGDFDIPKVSEFGFTLWAVFLAINPDVTLTIVGHTDNVGSQEYNQQLALTRAQVAKNQIGKTDPSVLDRITVIGKGPEQPIGDNTTAEGRQLNRRVEFAVYGFFTSQSSPSS